MLARTLGVREAYARDVFDINTVGMLIKARVEAGDDWLQVRQQRAMPLQSTRAAATLIAWLAKNGYRIDWQNVPSPDGDRDGVGYSELKIYWSKRTEMVSMPAEKYLADIGYRVPDPGDAVMPTQ